jgi:hypothetical protein
MVHGFCMYLEYNETRQYWVSICSFKRVIFKQIEICYSVRRLYKLTGMIRISSIGSFNPLALELDIYSLAHHLCKM